MYLQTRILLISLPNHSPSRNSVVLLQDWDWSHGGKRRGTTSWVEVINTHHNHWSMGCLVTLMWWHGTSWCLVCWNIQVNLISVNPLIMTWVFSIHLSYCYTYIYDVYMSCDICLIWIFISCSHLIFLFKTEMWVSLVFTLITPYSYYLIVNLF